MTPRQFPRIGGSLAKTLRSIREPIDELHYRERLTVRIGAGFSQPHKLLTK